MDRGKIDVKLDKRKGIKVVMVGGCCKSFRVGCDNCEVGSSLPVRNVSRSEKPGHTPVR